MEMKQNHKGKELVMSYEETEIPVVSLHITQLISDRARTPSHLSVPCCFLSNFTCFPAADEILTFYSVNRKSV